MVKEWTQLKVDLKDEHSRYFEWFKEKYGFSTNAETIRYIIDAAYNNENSILKWIKNFPLEKLKHIELVINREDVKNKYKIYSMVDFFHCAIDDLFKNICNNLKNLLDWEVKSTMIGEEKEVAHAFAEAYQKNGSNGVNLYQIMEFCDNKDEILVEKILNKFVSKQYIVSFSDSSNSLYNIINY